jgi:uncharacterized protein
MNLIESHLNEISILCVKHKVKTLFVFGSILGENFRKESDVEFIVDFSSVQVEDYADNYFDLKFSLQDILKRSIDLLEEKALKNPYFKKTLNEQKKLVY